jgi:hypothetical protein
MTSSSNVVSSNTQASNHETKIEMTTYTTTSAEFERGRHHESKRALTPSPRNSKKRPQPDTHVVGSLPNLKKSQERFPSASLLNEDYVTSKTETKKQREMMSYTSFIPVDGVHSPPPSSEQKKHVEMLSYTTMVPSKPGSSSIVPSASLPVKLNPNSEFISGPSSLDSPNPVLKRRRSNSESKKKRASYEHVRVKSETEQATLELVKARSKRLSEGASSTLQLQEALQALEDTRHMQDRGDELERGNTATAFGTYQQLASKWREKNSVIPSNTITTGDALAPSV